VLPVVALVGRPNVGKSTLFNVLTRTRDALVADVPGLTRDRKYGYARLAGRSCVVVDTGGLVESMQGIERLMAEQTLKAIEEADRVLLVVDAREGCTPPDQHVADILRRSGKTVLVVANKSEGYDPDFAVADFHQLGFGAPVPVAAAHVQGIDDLMERALEGLEEAAASADASAADGSEIRVAVVGRRTWQVHADQPPAGEERSSRSTAGDDARHGVRALRARRAALHAHRHGWRAAAGAGQRDGREVQHREDPAGHRAGERSSA
jgi:GTP-binding protein